MKRLLNGFPMTVGINNAFSFIACVYSSIGVFLMLPALHSGCTCKDTSSEGLGELQLGVVLTANISDLLFLMIC